jgi:hypothetical protein
VDGDMKFLKQKEASEKAARPKASKEIVTIQEQPWSVSVLLRNKYLGMYYNLREAIGQSKRDLVVKRVESARDGLEEAKEQFETALERFSALIAIDGGVLEEKFAQLNQEFELSQSRAKAVRERIKSVESVSEALFAEWQEELEKYQNKTLKNQSRVQLRQTYQHFLRLIKAMHRAETKMVPVLAAFQDQVLYLKHNLNAQAIASLDKEFVTVTMNITGLITAMEKSISEAEKFMQSLQKNKPAKALDPENA